MSYNLSPASINRVKPFLDLMLEADTNLEWHVKQDQNPNKLAFLIRQGIAAAVEQKDIRYATLKSKYMIRVLGNTVSAVNRDGLLSTQIAIQKLVIHEVTSLLEVIGATVKHNAEEIYFPNVVLSEDEKTKLYSWSLSNKYYMIVNLEGITLTRKENAKELAWEPLK